MLTSRDKTNLSGVTTSNGTVLISAPSFGQSWPRPNGFVRQPQKSTIAQGLLYSYAVLFCFFEDFFDSATVTEVRFWNVIVLAFENFLKAANGVLNWYIFTRDTGKLFTNEEWLGQEVLNLTSTSNCQLVIVAQLVHTQNCDDILQFTVTLENLLDAASHLVVLLTDNFRCQCTGSGCERIDRWIQTHFGNLTVQVGGCIQVRKCVGRSRVSVVIGRHVNGLDGRNGTLNRGRDAFLQLTHFSCERWLVTNGGWHTTEQCGNFRTGLCETEDVVHEEQYVAFLDIAEVFCDGQTGERNTKACSRRLVHLTEDHAGLVNNAGVLHFMVQVVTFTSTFTNTCEYGETAVFFRDVVNQFLNQDGFTNAGTAEQTDLTTLDVRSEQV